MERSILVLMFGQFEQAVNRTFEAALESRLSNPDWRHRRGWDISALRGRKVAFETKLALVLDSRHPAFSEIMRTYAIRNHCAHGGMSQAIGSIGALLANLYSWRVLLTH
ncbi:hypothetical protein SAMN04487976_107240 [Xaviernesmea oryzae]|nr:hypothetical protein SAMN04487976_107240 [Xaviernesmea oryzae]